MQDNLQIVMKAEDILRKADFEASFKKVLELLLAMEKRNAQAIADMQKSHAEMMKQMTNTHNENYNALKGQVDHVFVGDKVTSMQKNHEEMMAKISKAIANVKDGKTPTKQELIDLMKPLIPPPREGRPGKSENLSSILDAIKSLQDDMKKQKSRYVGGGGNRNIFKDIDISSSLDGVTKTFNIQAVWYVISVDLSSFPYGALRKTTDYTWTPTSLTFTSAIDAATQLAAGQTCIITAILPG